MSHSIASGMPPALKGWSLVTAFAMQCPVDGDPPMQPSCTRQQAHPDPMHPAHHPTLLYPTLPGATDPIHPSQANTPAYSAPGPSYLTMHLRVVRGPPYLWPQGAMRRVRSTSKGKHTSVAVMPEICHSKRTAGEGGLMAVTGCDERQCLVRTL